MVFRASLIGVGWMPGWQAGEEPAYAAAVAGALVGLPALLYWQIRFAGYSGLITAEKALAVLQTEDAVLVDIR